MSKEISWHIEKRKIADLAPAEYNPRTLTDKARTDLAKSISIFGQMEPLVINTNNNVIGGHSRITAFADLGIEECDVMVPSRKLTAAEEREANIRLNRNTGEWSPEKLKQFFNISELSDWGFEKDELSKFFDKNVEVQEDDFDAEAEAAKIKKPVSQLGDVWQLGEHRLACGDSTSREVFEQLMGEEKADMCFTDPPYNIGWDYNDRSQNRFNPKNKIFKAFSQGVFRDKWSPEEYIEFVKKVCENVFTNSIKNASIYVCHGGRYQSWTVDAIKKAGFHYSQDIIWVKERMIPMPGQLFHHLYEGIVVGWKKGQSPIRNFAYNKEDVFALGYEKFKEFTDIISDVWFEKRDNLNSYEHPTQKPVRLPERAIKKSCPIGSIVLEPFSGSFSTGMACEQLQRKCYAIELDPRYVDVAIRRWQRFTSKKAVCITRPEAVIAEV